MIKTLALTTLLSFGIAISACSSQASKNTAKDSDILALDLVHGYLLNWNGDTALEPSGLAICHEKLLMVSDDHPNHIFEIEHDFNLNRTPNLSSSIQRDSITVKKAFDIPTVDEPRQIPDGQDRANTPLSHKIVAAIKNLVGPDNNPDWEGISCEGQTDGSLKIHLVSEAYMSVLELEYMGPKLLNKKWLFPNLFSIGAKQGLFQKPNAYLEGLTYHNGRWILAAEREPRGLIRLNSEDDTDIYVQAGSHLHHDGLSYDFTGLYSADSKLHVLERNHHRVCEMTESNELRHCYSFNDISKQHKWDYNSDRYGKAEGLAMNSEYVFIVLDNNGDPRFADESDYRPTLFVFRNPY